MHFQLLLDARGYIHTAGGRFCRFGLGQISKLRKHSLKMKTLNIIYSSPRGLEQQRRKYTNGKSFSLNRTSSVRQLLDCILVSISTVWKRMFSIKAPSLFFCLFYFFKEYFFEWKWWSAKSTTGDQGMKRQEAKWDQKKIIVGCWDVAGVAEFVQVLASLATWCPVISVLSSNALQEILKDNQSYCSLTEIFPV